MISCACAGFLIWHQYLNEKEVKTKAKSGASTTTKKGKAGDKAAKDKAAKGRKKRGK